MLKEIIDKFYLEKQKAKQNKEQIKFYISEAGKCPRGIFFSFKNIPREELEAYRLRIFDHGDYIQQMTLKPLFSYGVIRATEIDIPAQEIVSGRADAIVSIEGKPYVLDVKSMNGMIFEKLNDYKKEHYWQVQLYLHYFKIPKGILLYVNKDNQQIKEFIFDYNPEVAERLLKNFEILREMINKDIVPARLPDYPENWQCKYCQYKEICKIAGQEKTDWKELRKKIELIQKKSNNKPQDKKD